jgi:hypothetical protein
VAEIEHEDLPGFTARLGWHLRTYTRQDLADRQLPELARMQVYGGVYIAMNHRGELQKVGEAGDFGKRARDYATEWPTNRTNRRPIDSRNWRFYIATIRNVSGEPARYVKGYSVLAQNAIARTLFRLGYLLPAHHTPRVVANVLGPVRVEHLLPKELLQLKTTPPRLATAYAATSDALGNNVPTYNDGRPALPHVLQLATDEKWEFE